MVVTTTFTFFFFNDTATTEIYTLSLHDALPIWAACNNNGLFPIIATGLKLPATHTDRKSTRLNSSHSQISYAVFCLKKKNNTKALTVCIIREMTFRLLIL